MTVPAMTWAARGKPGFVVVTFEQSKALSVSHCTLAAEWHVMTSYVFLFLLSIAVAIAIKWSKL